MEELPEYSEPYHVIKARRLYGLENMKNISCGKIEAKLLSEEKLEELAALFNIYDHSYICSYLRMKNINPDNLREGILNLIPTEQLSTFRALEGNTFKSFNEHLSKRFKGEK